MRNIGTRDNPLWVQNVQTTNFAEGGWTPTQVALGDIYGSMIIIFIPALIGVTCASWAMWGFAFTILFLLTFFSSCRTLYLIVRTLFRLVKKLFRSCPRTISLDWGFFI